MNERPERIIVRGGRVIDPAGRVVSIVDNNTWTAEELTASLKNAVGRR